MRRRRIVAAVSGFVVQAAAAAAMIYPAAQQAPAAGPAAQEGLAAAPSLEASPKGTATVLGGRIENVDQVRDQFILQVPGTRSMKITYDARTRIFRDGKRIASAALHAGDRASVETVLDDTHIFALSIHTLSQAPEGECQGQVLGYNASTHELTVQSELTKQPVKLLIPPEAKFSMQSAAAAAGPAALAVGTLVTVYFTSDGRGRGIAKEVAVVAIPGTPYVFTGIVTTLDLHAGLVVLQDDVNDKSYSISFDSSRLPAARELRDGQRVRVTATLSGNSYVASAVAVE